MLMNVGIIAVDAIAAYGPSFLSGTILLGAMPYRSMHPEIAHPVVMSLVPGLLSESTAEFLAAATAFAASCVSEDYKVPEEDRLAWIGGVAITVSVH